MDIERLIDDYQCLMMLVGCSGCGMERDGRCAACKCALAAAVEAQEDEHGDE